MLRNEGFTAFLGKSAQRPGISSMRLACYRLSLYWGSLLHSHLSRKWPKTLCFAVAWPQSTAASAKLGEETLKNEGSTAFLGQIWVLGQAPLPEKGLPTRRRMLSGGPKWLIVRGSPGGGLEIANFWVSACSAVGRASAGVFHPARRRDPSAKPETKPLWTTS